MELLWFILIGAVAGWLAGVIMKGKGFGILINIVVGIVGGFLGGWLFGGFFTFVPEPFGGLITAVIGACLLLFIISLIKKR